MPSQLTFALETPENFAREDFIVGPGNEAAVAFIDKFPDWPLHAAALHGPSGAGKTHLAHVWATGAGAAIVDAAALGDVLPGTPLAIENVDAVPPSEARDRALFALIESGRPLLLTGREPPVSWPAVVPDLASRFAALLSFALWTPDDALLEALARRLFARRQLQVPDAVIAQMIRALERTPGAVRDFVARADALALAEKRPITTALIRELLETQSQI